MKAPAENAVVQPESVVSCAIATPLNVGGAAANLASGHDVEDAVAVHFRAGDGRGAVGTSVWNFAAADNVDRIEITGTDGRIVMSTFGNEPVRFEDRAGVVESFDLPNPPHVQQPLIQTIVDELLGRAPAGHCPSTGASAARTSRVMDEALKGYYGGRDDAFFNDLPGFFRSINYAPQFYRVPLAWTDRRELPIPKTLLELEGNALFNFDPANPRHGSGVKTGLPPGPYGWNGAGYERDENGEAVRSNAVDGRFGGIVGVAGEQADHDRERAERRDPEQPRERHLRPKHQPLERAEGGRGGRLDGAHRCTT